MEIEEFAKGYNKLVDYNLEILNQLGLGDVNSLFKHKYISEIVNDYLGLEKINEDDFEYETAELYEYEENGKQVFELQIYNRNYGGMSYFWLNSKETEKEYKRKKIEAIYKSVSEISKNTIDQITSLKEKYNELADFGKKLYLFGKKIIAQDLGIHPALD